MLGLVADLGFSHDFCVLQSGIVLSSLLKHNSVCLTVLSSCSFTFIIKSKCLSHMQVLMVAVETFC